MYYLVSVLFVIILMSLNLFIVLVKCDNHVNNLKTMGTKAAQVKYLKTFGYFGDKPMQENKQKSFELAVKKFQEMWGLKISGKVDDSTKSLMEERRCVNIDIPLIDLQNNNRKRQRRFAVLPFGGWKKTSLTYRVLNRPGSLNASQVLYVISKAFKQWSKVSSLTFTRVKRFPDIDIWFVAYKHGDGTFDGLGGIVAHTFYPIYGGDIHFDASENWTVGTGKGTDLFQTAVHEIGHALGLSHSRDKQAVMYPYYKYQRIVQLGEDDVKGIKFLYDNSRLYRSMSISYRHSCENNKIDAGTTLGNGNIMIFIGKYIILLDHRGSYTGYPQLISDVMPDLPNNIDAAIHLPMVTGCKNRKQCSKTEIIYKEQTFFFKGDYYYLYDKNIKLKEKGKISSTFPGIPSTIDAAFSHDHKHLYIVKGVNYWRISRGAKFKVDKHYPRKFSQNFKGLPRQIDAAFTGYKHTKTGQKLYYTFFFKGRKFYRITGTNFQVDKSRIPFPRMTEPKWFDCMNLKRLISR